MESGANLAGQIAELEADIVTLVGLLGQTIGPVGALNTHFFVTIESPAEQDHESFRVRAGDLEKDIKILNERLESAPR